MKSATWLRWFPCFWRKRPRPKGQNLAILWRVLEPDDPNETHGYLAMSGHEIWMPLKAARLVAQTRNAEEADYARTLTEILECDPIPACERLDDRLEPPWEVVARMRKGWLSFRWVKRHRWLLPLIGTPIDVEYFVSRAETNGSNGEWSTLRKWPRA